MNQLRAERQAADRQLSPPKWKGAQSIRMAHKLNEQCINLLCDLAFESFSDAQWPIVESNRDLWRRLDSNARRRLAALPFAIIDMRFWDETWWRAVSREHSASITGAEVQSAVLGQFECLALETLMFAWQVAREDRHVAQLVLAMAPSVADLIASFTMHQIRITAIRGAGILCVRWDDDVRFWRDLLMSVRESDEAAIQALRRDAKLLFCGELLGARRGALLQE
ncbi:MAG: hypothetical protein WDO12_01190 [Pseudomonadota bacterium]